MLLRVVLAMLLAGCAARGRRTEEAPDPAIVAVDLAWEDRGQIGLGGVEDVMLKALGGEGREDDPQLQWRYARLLVHRGMVEEDERRSAMDRYAGGRAQAMACLEQKPAWQQRRREAGLEAALDVVAAEDLPCLAWGTLAWARWIALMGGDAAALDLDSVAAMAKHLEGLTDPALASLGTWAGALVAASRTTDGAADRARKRFETVFAQRPNDLVPHWDLLALVARPAEDQALIAREERAIRDAQARMPTDRAVKKWLEATE